MLDSHQYVKVNAITYDPSHWYNDDNKHHGIQLIFILNGAKDNGKITGIGLFPEILRNELHEVRSVIESYSNNSSIQGIENSNCCGMFFNNSNNYWNCRLKVITSLGEMKYKIDRWD